MNQTLQQWMDEETTTLARFERGAAAFEQSSGPDKAHARSAMAAMNGLQQMQALLRGELPAPSIGRTLDFLLIEVSDGVAIYQGTPGPGHLNPMGAVHGGWYATLLDSALGCSIHTRMPVGKAYTTLELKVNLIRALKPNIQRVRAIGRVIHVGNQTAIAEARLEGPDGKLYAHGTTTCLVFDVPSTVRKPGGSTQAATA